MNARYLLVAVLGCGLFAAVACGGDDVPPTNEPTEEAGTPIGASGGSLTSADGKLRLTVPEGALDHEVRITVEVASGTPAGTIGTVYEIGPSGTQFATAARLTFTYDRTQLGDAQPSALRVATVQDGAWVALDGALLDEQAGTVSGGTLHLSPYGVIAVPCQGDADCPTGQVCANGACTSGCGNAEVCGNGVDDDCDGAVDEGCQTGGCRSDAECAAGEVCANGVCQPGSGCPAGTVACGGACADLTSDSANCGACGAACATGQACVYGACQGGCAQAEVCGNGLDDDCNGAVDDGCQTGCQSDAGCAAGEVCLNGACQPGNACPAGTVACGGACSDLTSDSANCGACGAACASGQTCAYGACQGGCGQAEVCGNGIDDDCNGAVDDGCQTGCQSDAGCAAGEVCQNGVCQPGSGCPAGTAACNGACADVSSDPVNCGACGVACATGQACVYGQCQGGCGQAEVCGNGIDDDCDGLVDEGCQTGCQSDAGCAAGEVCLNGVCQPGSGCPAGTAACGGACVDLSTDSANCGACGSACGTGQACVYGACQGSCGQAEICGNGVDDDCDGVADEGCPTPCQTSQDCAAGQTCAQGFCW